MGGGDVQRIGIVLGGGGIRSMAHIGVLREIEKLGIPIHHVAGTSAGSIIGTLFAAGTQMDRIEQEARSLTWRTVFEPAILWQRAITGTRLMRYLEGLFGGHKTFESLRLPLSITAVELIQGRMVVFDKGPLLPAIRASLALPGAIRPVSTSDGNLLVDGGVLGSVPTQPLREAGCDVVIAVDVRSRGNVAPRPPQRWRRADLIRRVGEVMTEYITDIALEQADVVIRPRVDGIGSFEVGRIGACIDAGVQAVEEMADGLKELIAASSSAATKSGPAGNESVIPSVLHPS